MGESSPTAQELIESCQGLVRSLALGVQRKVASSVELDDLIAYGQVGLAEAARDFDPARGAKFSTYAYYRIRGAIYDGLSRMSWGNKTHQGEQRYEYLSNDVLRIENEQDTNAGAATLEENWSWLQNVSGALAVVYLSTQGSEEESLAFDPCDEMEPRPETTVMTREIIERLRELIDGLPKEAGSLIRGVYFQGQTLEEAGKAIGVSKSWASRLHARTLKALARSLRAIGAT